MQKMKDKMFGIICLLLAVVILIVTVIHYYPKIMDYKKGRDTYNEIRNEYIIQYNEDTEAEESEVLENIDIKTESETEIKEEAISFKKEFNYETEQETEAASAIEIEIESETEPTKEEKKRSRKKMNTDITNFLEIIDPDLNPDDYMCIDVDGKALLKKNPDYIGWIYIPKTSISYPVVLSKDNNDYLHTNFNKEYNYPGTIFIDCRNKETVLDHHMVIYGHNMKDGSMFAQIKSYIDEDFMKEHPFIWFITPTQKLLYRVFSAYEASPDDNKVTFTFQGEEFKNNEEWDKIIKEIKKKSEVPVKQHVNGLDFVITLSTCTSKRVTRITPSAVLIGEYLG